MSALRLLAVGCVVGLIGAGARADDKPDYAKLIVGTWEVTKADEGTARPGTVIEFTKDGKAKAMVKKDDGDTTIEGTYKIDGDKLALTTKRGEEERTQTITITKLTDTEMGTKNDQGKAVELKKKK
jgi:uncharacterized protein (TIGR03066 family)